MELVDAGYNVNQPDHENVSVLHWAAINNRMEIVRYTDLLFNDLAVTVFTVSVFNIDQLLCRIDFTESFIFLDSNLKI